MSGEVTVPAPASTRLVHLGLLLAAGEREHEQTRLYFMVRDRLLGLLAGQFPQFQWEIAVVTRRRFSPLGAIDPLALLEFAVRQKIERRWDYTLVLVPNELNFRDRRSTWGVPSSALEVAVVSTAAVSTLETPADEVARMSLHLLGHLWGLEHEAEGPMCPADLPADLRGGPFPPEQQRAIVARLKEVADTRIEEGASGRTGPAFYLQTFRADPRGILTDLYGYTPWRLPFRLGRLTAGAITFVVILLLTAETWEVGVNFSPSALAACTALAVPAAAAFLFIGQNLAKMSGADVWHEQLVRTRIVLFGSLLVGMASLWVVLWTTAFVAGLAMPDAVLGTWLARPPGMLALFRQAAFMATLGLLGGALGGNLEDEGNFQAKFLFDEDS